MSSTTETNVDIDAPAAATIQNMTVQMSAAPGIGNSIVLTWRKNASSTTLTCTISGASATSCSDTTHNFTAVSLDLLDIQVVTTGTIVGTPTIIMAAQIGVAASGTIAFSSLAGGTNTLAAMLVGSGASLAPTGTGTLSANQVNGAVVPASAPFIGSNSSSQLVAGGSVAWTTTTPSISCQSGSLTSGSSSLNVGTDGGKTRYVGVIFTITTIGTCSYPQITLPFTPATSGLMLCWNVNNTIDILTYTGGSTTAVLRSSSNGGGVGSYTIQCGSTAVQSQ